MAGTDTYDYTTDPDFLSAKPDQQHAYLMSNDPDYAKANPEQQQAYRGHLTQHIPTGSEALAKPPVESNPEVNKVGGQIREKGRIQKIGAPSELTGTSASPSEDAATAGLTSTALGAVVNPAATIGSVVGGAVGAPIVSSGARRVTSALGGGKEAQDTAGTIGGYTGLIGGGLLGGGLGGNVKFPEELNLGIAKMKTPSFLNPEVAPTMEEEAAQASQRKLAQRDADIEAGVTQHPGVPAHAEMEADIAQQHQNRVAANDEMNREISEGHQFRVGAREEMGNGLASSRMNRVGDTATEGQQMSEGHDVPLGPSTPTSEENLTRAEKAGKAVKLPNRMPARYKSAAGAGPAGGSNQEVTTIPEPNRPGPGENPNNQQSVPRKSTLVENAKRGKEGAGLQLNQVHGPVLYEPKGAGYSGVRQWDPNAPPEPPEAGPTVGNGKPIVPTPTKPGLTNTPSNGLPHINDLEDAFRSKGAGPADAYRLAKETLDEASGATTVPEANRKLAMERIQRIMGPEQRGPNRLGPEARGIK